jgi:ferredoxin
VPARVVLTAFTVLLAGCAGSSDSDSQRATEQTTSLPSAASNGHPGGVIIDCSMRSMADFGPAFADPQNLVVGPLLLVGGAEITPEAVVLAHDGQKFPLLVKAGHTVTVDVPSSLRKTAGLAYGPCPEGAIKVEEAHDTITFVACGRDDPSGSTAGGPVTFWSGFVMTSVPRCLPLDVYVGGEAAPRRVEVALGADCKGIRTVVASS